MLRHPRRAALAPLLASALASGCGASSDAAEGAAGPVDDPTTVVLSEGDLRVTVHLDRGTLDVARGERTVLVEATADVLVDDGATGRTVSLFGHALARDGASAFTATVEGLTLRLALALPPGQRHLEATLTATNAGSATTRLLKLAPLVVEAAHGGALVLGRDPARHRILENGRYVAFDTTAQVVAGDAPPFGLGFALPIHLRGSSASNWNHLVADLDDPASSLVAGFLTFERSVPTLGIAYDSTAARATADGRTPFTTWAAETALVFHGKPLAPGASVDSETAYLDPLPHDPLEALEHYADVVAAHLGTTPWPQRAGAGHDVPNGWNSWSGGSGTGGYGQGIDAGIIAANEAVLRDQLLPFGDTAMQVDDGWQRAHGDWQFDATKFPAGGKALAAGFVADGFLPGLWIAPFAVDPESELAKAHPGWIAKPESGLVGVIAGDGPVLDLSNPEVLAFLTQLAKGLRDDGWRWIKADYTYRALLGQPGADPTLTNVEAFRAGWRALRAGLGDDVHLLGIGLQSSNAGVVDSMRLTLDNGPKWNEDSADDVVSTPRAFQSVERTAARRWYYQNHLMLGHADDLYFRAWPDPKVPALTFDEARTFATFVGMTGGPVELGDKLVDLRPAEIDVVRRLVPAWPDSARPIDVLTRDYPEHFVRHVVAPAGTWDVVGLMHWGDNRDLSASPPLRLASDAPRSFEVACAGDCLAWDFWSETFLGHVRGSTTLAVEPHGARVVSLRPATAVPSLVGTNRHVTVGATDLGPLSWDDATRTLSGTLLGAVGTSAMPWRYHLAFYVPAGFTFDAVTVDGVAAPEATTSPELLDVRFALPPAKQGASVAFAVRFR